MKPHAKLYVSSRAVRGVFGDGKYRLLEAVHEHGSLQKAAAALGRSYRKAWGDIKRAEEGLGRALVVRTRGGKAGGTTVLTSFGQSLLGAWEKYRSAVETSQQRLFEKHVRPLIRK